MMAASECTHVSDEEIDNETSLEKSESDIIEFSSIVEPVTPSDVIVQRQIREVLFLQNAAVEHLHESVTGHESMIRDHLVPREEHLSKLKEVEQSIYSNYISREDYEELAKRLEQEQQSHAQTRLHLSEVRDKLDFTLGEVDILNTQLNREKDTFQQIVDSLRSQVVKGDNWNQELDGQYAASQKQVQDLEARLASRESSVVALEGRLLWQQQQCERRMEEVDVERQQDQYIQSMLDPGKGSRGKKAFSSASSTHSRLKAKR